MITLKTLPQATAQEVFDQVKAHLLKQNAQSFSRKVGKCAYRGDRGMMCAAGCLIADDEYSYKMEAISWGGLVRNAVVPLEHEALIADLQYIHDNNDPIFWPQRLQDLANELGLRY